MAIPRVLEPEVMATFEEATDYDSMDHSQVNQQFVKDLLTAGDVAGDCLDMGTGTAQIPVALCEAAVGFRVAALDLSTEMLDLARYNLEVAGVMDRITLIHGDAKSLEFPEESFDLVFSNSIVHHIPEPLPTLREAVRVARGWLFFRDLMRPESDDEVDRLVETYAAETNEHQRKMFHDSLRAALTLEEIGDMIREIGGDPARQLQATSDRHWTWIAARDQLT